MDEDQKREEEMIRAFYSNKRKQAMDMALKTMRSITETIKVKYVGRPVRDTVISRDDIVNLRIVLNTTSTVEEFLKVI
jgi:hypothetical protein